MIQEPRTASSEPRSVTARFKGLTAKCQWCIAQEAAEHGRCPKVSRNELLTAVLRGGRSPGEGRWRGSWQLRRPASRLKLPRASRSHTVSLPSHRFADATARQRAMQQYQSPKRRAMQQYQSQKRRAMQQELSRKLRRLLLGRKAMTNLDSILKSRDDTLPIKVHLVRAMIFPVVTHSYESWT